MKHPFMKFPIGNMFLLTLLLNILSAQEKDIVLYYSPSAVLDFANYLFTQKEYIRAASEYERYRFISQADQDSVALRIGICYSKSPQYYSTATAFLRNFIKARPKSSFLAGAGFYMCYSYFQLAQYDSCVSCADVFRSVQNPVWCEKMNFLIISSYIMLQKHSEAEQLLKLGSYPRTINAWHTIEKYSQIGESIPRKKPWIAGTMSAVLPGLGKIYAGRSIDGLFSMLLFGFMTWQSLDGFHDKGRNSSRGWFYASLGSVFYVGNIFGSALAAKVVYSQETDELKTNVRLQVQTIFEH
jgi:hypothetical protein